MKTLYDSLDEILGTDAAAEKLFWDDCVAIFSTGAGARVLTRICEIAHPTNHAPVADPVLSAHLRGRSEVVAALWRRSQPIITPQDLPKP